MNPQDMKDADAHADLRTLIEAAKIHSDKKRHGAAMKAHKQLSQHLAAVATQQPIPDPSQSNPGMTPTNVGGM